VAAVAEQEVRMKKVTIAMAAILALLSVTGCANTGKGKAPPPVVTKG
jgi:predicted small lipoprotein YifL